MEAVNTISRKVDARKYGRLLSNTLPTVIKSEKENDRAIAVVGRLLAKGKSLSKEESALVELLGKLIADFEEKFYSPKNALPQEVLLELMQASGLIQADLVDVFGSKSRVSEAVNGKREISKSQARALGEYFRVSAELFI